MQPIRFGAEKPIEVVAHRGSQTLADYAQMAPENTMPAFEDSARRGASIELDVIATKDGTPVVYHDDETGKIFSIPTGDKWVREATDAEIFSAKLNVAAVEKNTNKRLLGRTDYKLNPAFADLKIPTLKAVIEGLPATQRYYLELKTDTSKSKKNNRLEESVAQIIKEKNLYDRVTVISFHPWSLLKIKRLDPKIKTGLDFEFPKFFQSKFHWLYLLRAKLFRVDSVHPPFEETSAALVDKARKMGFKIAPWVNNDTRTQEQERFPKLIAMGVDGIMTNAVDLLQEALKKQAKPALS